MNENRRLQILIPQDLYKELKVLLPDKGMISSVTRRLLRKYIKLSKRLYTDKAIEEAAMQTEEEGT